MIPKFRAYVKNENKIYPVTRIDWVYEDVQMDERPYEEVRKSLFTLPIDDVVTMQSTGLFDKNGKEIFEGDILKCTSFDGCLWCETVSWDSTIAGFATHQNGYDATPIEYITDSKAITIEIIGNVYQNLELLEENNGE